jgi:hypothetical protein
MEPIEFNYKKLRVAQDLTKKTLGTVAMRLLRKDDNGTFIMPSDNEIASYINGLAEKRLIKHYVLQGEYEKIYLFDSDEIISQLDIMEVEAKKVTEIVKIQCYDKRVNHTDNVPIEISKIEELYRIPETLFQSGTCVYFLCREGKVVYVGKAENIHSRLIEHHKTKNFDDVFYIRVSANRMSKIESSLIAYLRPEYNQTCLSMDNQKRALAEGVLNTDNSKSYE